MAKKTNLKEKSDQELVTLLSETRAELRTVRFNAAGARAKDSNMPQKLKRTVARVLTEQHARKAKAAA